ncbi:MAG: hypothetical protein GF403_11535 [Candidatus Coatesbacteria bacterium]|nr:hypothetical protein [Candidatus Coatesbacteria bacterium]
MNKTTLILAGSLLLLFTAACDDEPESIDEGAAYSLVEPTLTQETYQPGDSLEVAYTVANPALDAEGNYDIYVNLDVTLDDEPYDAYPQIEHRKDSAQPLELAHTVELTPEVYLPGAYVLKLTVTNRVDGENETLETELPFTIEGPPTPEAAAESQPGELPQEEALTH